MKKRIFGLAAAAGAWGVGAAAGGVMAPALYNIGTSDDFEAAVPLAITVGVGAGYDSNVNVSAHDEHSSWFYQAGVGLEYSEVTRTTSYSLGLEGSVIYYEDPAPGLDDTFYNVRGSFNIQHRVNERLTIGDQLFVAYEVEPDYAIGGTVARRTDQYLYAYNNLSVAYAWSRRFSTVTNYTVSGVDYEDDDFGAEDHINHIFGHQFRYALSRVTTGTLEYRFRYTEYDRGFNDFISHYVLAGVDHSFNPNLRGSLRAGAEFRDYDERGESTAPYVEGALNYQAGKLTTVRAYNRLGLEAVDLGTFEEHYAYRAGVSAVHQFTRELSANAGVHYIHSEFEGSPVADDFDEDVISLSVGFNYYFWENLALYGNYYFTNVSSDNEFRDYDRHRVLFGVSATF